MFDRDLNRSHGTHDLDANAEEVIDLGLKDADRRGLEEAEAGRGDEGDDFGIRTVIGATPLLLELRPLSPPVSTTRR